MLIRVDITKIIIGGHSPPMQQNNDLSCQVITIKIYTMKQLKLPLGITLIYCLFCFAQCRKTPVDNNSLPAATQDGKNTFGFLLNGQPWTPQGNSGTGNLSIDFDQGFNNGILGIVAYRTISASDKTQFILGVADSLNFKIAPFTLLIKKKSIGGLSFSTKNYCDILHADTTIYESGKINITKLDRTSRIVSGTFEGILYKQICGDTIKITDGRFDMKF
jgi:hypothetical protein